MMILSLTLSSALWLISFSSLKVIILCFVCIEFHAIIHYFCDQQELRDDTDDEEEEQERTSRRANKLEERVFPLCLLLLHISCSLCLMHLLSLNEPRRFKILISLKSIA